MGDTDRLNVVTCSAWVPQGAAKQDPEKVEITKEELEKILQRNLRDLGKLENVDEDEYTGQEVSALEEDMKLTSTKSKKKKNKNKNKNKCEDVEMEEVEESKLEEGATCISKPKHNYDENAEDIEKRYDFDNYDEEQEGVDLLMQLGKLTMHADIESDAFITRKEEEESEIDDNKILPSDNLITVGHVDGDASILEVYVYNSEEGSMYVHHDILLPAVPFCMEWFNFDPELKDIRPGNLVAIGSMSPVIDVWDLDLLDSLEPSFRLGRLPEKKKKISREGHSDAVLCLAWNGELEHILASGSVDQTIVLWDLETQKESKKESCSGKVQDLKWNQKENYYLLAGCSDKSVQLFDFSSSDTRARKWTLDGEVESIVWNPANDRSNNFFASTDVGSVYSFDIRQAKPIERFQAHDTTCTGMVMNALCPGCLSTVSEDGTMKVWDVGEPKAKLVDVRPLKIGIVHGVSCSPDSPFVLSFAGDNKLDNFRVYDIRRSKKVRSGFFDRLGLPIEDGEDDEVDDVVANDDEEEDIFDDYKIMDGVKDDDDDGYVDMEESSPNGASNQSSKWKPKKKSKKKKGGHLDQKK